MTNTSHPTHLSVRLDDETGRELQALVDHFTERQRYHFLGKITPSDIVRRAIHEMYLQQAGANGMPEPIVSEDGVGLTAPRS
jgi:hypothetical protein